MRFNGLPPRWGGDETIRLWSLPEGKLQRTYRVPTDAEGAGRLYAVAVSPDGQLLAAAGATGQEWERFFSAYLMDVATGRMKHRFSRLPAAVSHLAFSGDGRHLAVLMAGKQGLRVFRSSGGRDVARDGDYAGTGNAASFGPQGELVTTSADGLVRLYDAGFRLIRSKRMPGRYRPHGVAFSPDGSMIAVGIANAPKVLVLSASTLELLYLPDTGGIYNGLRTVAWSADGRGLYAAGGHHVNGRRMIRWWSGQGQPDAAGRGEFVDLPASEGTVTALTAMKQGGVLYAAADPAIGLLDALGFQVFSNGRPTINFRKAGGRLEVSPHGGTVLFSLDSGGGQLARFDVEKLELRLNARADPQLGAAITTSESFTLHGWGGPTDDMTLNGRALKLVKNEKPLAFSVDGGDRYLVLGTAIHLRLYDIHGRERWKTEVPGPVRGVAVSGDSRYVVAVLGDGTIRWYEAVNGKELLAFFLHSDLQRWAAWTPGKHYVVSQGGEGLIGWLKNQGKGRAAKFSSSEAFASRFNQPDRIRRLLAY